MFKTLTLRYKYAYNGIKSPLFLLMILEILSIPTFLLSGLLAFLLAKYKLGYIKKANPKDLLLVKKRFYWSLGTLVGFLLSPFLGDFYMGLVVFIYLAMFFGNWGGHLLTIIHEKTYEVKQIEDNLPIKSNA